MPTVAFVPGRKSGKANAIYKGHRYILNRKRKDRSYWKCALWYKGCKGRLVLGGNNELDSNKVMYSTEHENDVQHAEISVHIRGLLQM